MTRSEFVALLNEHFRYQDIKDVDSALDCVFEHLTQGLSKGGRVELRGLGSFGTREHKPHQGRNPRTGEAVSVQGKRVPFFRAGKELRERVNGLMYGKDQHCE